MADKCLMFLLGLIILCSFPTGVIGAEVTHVFSSSGESVRLPCNKASGCTSTTWNYDRLTYLETVELVTNGKMKNSIKRRERLSLGSDCSLNIEKVTQEDYGIYVCQQHGGQHQGTDAHVYLHFLQVSSSSSHTEIRPGSVTLFCQLYSYNRFSCDTLVRTEGIQLVWVNQAGVSVMTDSRYQISFSSRDCISTLTSTLLNEDLSRDLRCQVTQRNESKTSATFTVKDSAPTETKTRTPVTSSKTTSTVVTSAQPAQTDTVTPVILVHTANSEDPSTTNTPKLPKLVFPLVMVVIIPGLAVLLPAVMLWVIYTKKADYKEEVVDSDVLTHVTYSGIPAENMPKRVIYSY